MCQKNVSPQGRKRIFPSQHKSDKRKRQLQIPGRPCVLDQMETLARSKTVCVPATIAGSKP
jgi:hypothetical protein